MDTRTAGIAIERALVSRQDQADAENDAADQCFAELEADQLASNWGDLLSAEAAEQFVRDWIADPAVLLGEFFHETAKVAAGIVCHEDAARIILRAIELSVKNVSTTQVEQKS